MSSSLIDLIVHPVRLQILQLLSVRQLTTQEISAALPDVPVSSLYRHLKRLRASGLIAVAETKSVRGIQEKVYRLAGSPHVGPEAAAEMTPADHLRTFIMYTAALIQGFAGYVHNTPDVDPVRDQVGYTEALFYATPEQLADLIQALNARLKPLLEQGPGEGRRLRKLGVITHPVMSPDPEVSTEDDAAGH
ncbi:MAG: hypothetical protein Kow0077_13870 [Anaerolineae bacterium]